MMKPIVVCVILAVPGGVLCAQEAASPGAASFRGMVRLNRAPVSNEVLKVKLPRPVERQLSNGLKLVILESHRAPTISLTISRSEEHTSELQSRQYLVCRLLLEK